MSADEDELRARAKARIGTVLRGKYHVDRLLGAGGMAIVYAATHRNRSRVAVKILHPELAVDASMRTRFVREGYVANTVDHRGAVRVLDDDVSEDGAVFLVMELLEGETLDARWERNGRRLPAREVATFMRDLLDVLAAAHAKGVVHRDIKPENVFLTRDGTLKVLDFGVARLREASLTATRSGHVFGTPAFMPPEQALGSVSQIGAVSDVWAVGATAFTLLSGQLVHEAETAGQMVIFAATKPAPKLASVAPDVPASLAGIIDRALAFEKGDRWSDASAMRDALSRALEAETWERDEVRERPIADEEKTKFAAPPLMTVRDDDLPTVPRDPDDAASTMPRPRPDPPSTVPMPTLKRSTIDGVAAPSDHRRARSRYALAATVGIAGGLGIVGIVVASMRSTSGAGPVDEGAALLATTNDSEFGAADAGQQATSVDSSPPFTALPSTIPSPPSSAPNDMRAPTAAATAQPATPSPASSPTSSAGVPPHARPNCTLPYVVDRNGLKKWKLECL